MVFLKRQKSIKIKKGLCVCQPQQIRVNGKVVQHLVVKVHLVGTIDHVDHVDHVDYFHHIDHVDHVHHIDHMLTMLL